tara:strand:- start:19809 stop:21005 length:1197 start_codon:yes stop_codon:yes gene_type:complete
MESLPESTVKHTDANEHDTNESQELTPRNIQRANLAGAALGIVNRVASFLAGPPPEQSSVFFSAIGPNKPPGILELRNSQLSEALRIKTDFSASELESFGIEYVPADICIEVDGVYYRIEIDTERSNDWIADGEDEFETQQTGAANVLQQSAVISDPNSLTRPSQPRQLGRNGSIYDDKRIAKKGRPLAGRQKQQAEAVIVHKAASGKTQSAIRAATKIVTNKIQRIEDRLEEGLRETAPVNVSDMTKAIKDGISGAIDEQREKSRSYTFSSQPEREQFTETLGGIDKEILSVVAQAARPGKRVSDIDVQFAALAVNITISLAIQMKHEYIRRFRCRAPSEEIVTAQNSPMYMKEILCAFRLLEMCMRTQWTRVSTQKRVEIDFHVAVKQAVERALVQ